MNKIIRELICGRWHHGYRNLTTFLDHDKTPDREICCTGDLFKFLDTLSDKDLLNVFESQAAQMFRGDENKI